jgi:hypothetical protein
VSFLCNGAVLGEVTEPYLLSVFSSYGSLPDGTVWIRDGLLGELGPKEIGMTLRKEVSNAADETEKNNGDRQGPFDLASKTALLRFLYGLFLRCSLPHLGAAERVHSP